jgi:predicted dehydrogenase
VRHYDEPATMLDAQKPDAAIICTPNHSHLDIGKECIDRGIPLLMEKPIAHTYAAALELAGLARVAAVPLLVGHHRRHNPLVVRTREAIREGAVGKLVMANVSCLMYKPDAYFDIAWRRQRGAGPVLINLIHEVDLIRYICGEVASVQAVSSNAMRGYEVEDSVSCSLQLANGALVSIALSDTAASPWSWETAAGEDTSLFPQRLVPTHLFSGTHGALSMPDLTHWYYAGARGRQAPISSEKLMAASGNAYASQLAHFIRVARREAEPVSGGLDAARTLEVTLAVQEAAATGERLALPPARA